MKAHKNIALFCGSSEGRDSRYSEAAQEMGMLLHERGYGMVYGGGNRGLMGIAAQSLHERGGRVIGVLPQLLNRSDVRLFSVEEQLIIVDSMHERKATMYDLSDGFIALPGGVGTFEEILEIFTWLQLGLHQKPVALLNVAGFYDPLVNMLTHARAEGFIKEELLDALIVEADPRLLLTRIETYDVILGDKLR